jgi:uncharacterized protein YaaQ
MKLRSVALVGVVCIATLGLIGAGARAVFTTSTTSGQTITAGTGWTTTHAPTRLITSSNTTTTTTDPTAPTASITYPVDGTTYGADWTGTITGTASSGAGTTITATAMVAIEDTTTNQWWNGTAFAASTQSFVTATGNTTWLLGLEAGSLTSGDSYSVIAEATDSAGNVGTSSTVSFTYGTASPAPPTVSVTYPVDGTSYGADWTGTITGTASTTDASTQVAIEDTTADQWWSGTSFSTSTQTFVPVSGTTTWLLGLEAGSLTSGDSYSVVAQATDSAGKVGTSSPVKFTYGTAALAPPTVSVTYPVDGTTYGADWTGTITGTASSGASTTIAGTQVAIEDTSANMWWNGTAFAASTQSFVTATGNTTWLLGLEAGSLTSGDSYSVVAQATDSAGNLGTSSTVSFTYNSTAQALGTSNG